MMNLIKPNLDYLVCSYSQSSKKKELEGRNNEDAILVNKREGIYLLADGVGSHKVPDMASQLAVKLTYMQLEGLANGLKNKSCSTSDIPEIITDSFALTNLIIHNMGNSYGISKRFLSNLNRFKNNNSNLDSLSGLNFLNNAKEEANKLNFDSALAESIDGLATTLDLVFIYDGVAYTGHVGDGRIMHLNPDKQISYLTDEHVSFMGEKPLDKDSWTLLESGLGLDSYIGQGQGIKIDLNSKELISGDIINIFSDGVSRVLTEREIANNSKNFLKSAKKTINQTNTPNEMAKLYSHFKDITLDEAKTKLQRRDDASIIGIKAYQQKERYYGIK